MSPPNGPTLLRPRRMDYNRMNSFLEYPLCNRAPSAYSAPTSFPPSSAPSVDSYAGETRYGGGLPSPALQQNSGYPAQHPPSALGVPFPSSGTSGYAPTACSPSYGPSQYYPLGQPEGDGGYFHPSSYAAQLGALSDSYGTAGTGPGPYPPPQPPYGNEQTGNFAPAYAELLSEDKESPCPSETSLPTARTFDWMKVKRNPPKTGRAQRWLPPLWGSERLCCFCTEVSWAWFLSLRRQVEAGKSTPLPGLRSGGVSPTSECPVPIKSKSPHIPALPDLCAQLRPRTRCPAEGWGMGAWGG